MTCRSFFCVAIALVILQGRESSGNYPDFTAVGQEAAIPVRLVQANDNSWHLEREGQEYRIRGAGGEGSFGLLKSLGGNSGRVWGVDKTTADRLDEAHAHGMTVAVGIWLEHERKGFSYDNPEQTQTQFEVTLDAVRTYKDHPAVLVWGIGNEMEGVTGDNPAIWKHIEAIAAEIKKIDPNHPTMTVIAEIGGGKLEAIHKFCPSIDIIGVNSYGGVASLAERYREAGATKPYVVTEFGPNGPWEVGRNEFGAVDEQTSTEKSADYRNKISSIDSDKQLCLGSYAFLWGNKQEATATWFGLLLPDGNRTAAVDVLTEVWSGRKPANACPAIADLKWLGSNQVEPGATLSAGMSATDPEGDNLKATWVLQSDADNYITNGDFQKTPPQFEDAIVESDLTGAKVNAPRKPGLYRLYVYVRDNQQGAATGNLVFRVKGESYEAETANVPCVVYDDESSGIWQPTGWMGNTAAISMDAECRDNPKQGATCLKVTYSAATQWGGVVWQNPANDWGDLAGGRDLSAASKLTFWARGENGGEKLKFGLGLLGRDKVFPDSGKMESPEIVLEREWKQYTLDLQDTDLSCIKTGFYFTLAGQGKPVVFWLDAIVFE